LLENAAASSNRDVRLLGWRSRDASTALLAHAAMLIFPSRGPESLSRVLIEASAIGIPIAAMNTGGTGDIVLHGQTGLLSTNPEGLADDVRTLRGDSKLRTVLGEAAALRARSCFDTSAVVPRIERVYDEVIRERRR